MAKVIVLDLDHTLVHTHESSFNEISPQDRQRLKDEYGDRLYFLDVYDYKDEDLASDKHVRMYGFLRPWVGETIRWAHAYFDIVIIWTMGTRGYARKIVPVVYRDTPHLAPDYIFSRETGVPTKNGELSKPLARLTKMCEREIPLERTIIVDDQPYSIKPNPDSGIQIPPFSIHLDGLFDDLNRKDVALQQVRAWFESPLVKEAKDWRRVDKKHIFV